MKRHFTLIVSMALAVFVGLTAFPAQADDAAKSGREILAKYQQAVVTVKLAIKQSISMGSHDSKSESKTETTGTVIDPSGLTVVSLATTDPGSAMKDSYARAMAARGDAPNRTKRRISSGDSAASGWLAFTRRAM